MVSQVDNGILVGGGGVINLQLILAGQGVNDLSREVAGITLFPVAAQVGELQGGSAVAGGFLRRPQTFIESDGAAMQAVVAVIAGKSAGDAIESEPAMGDAIGEAANDGAKVSPVGFIAGERLVAEDDIGKLASTVGNQQIDDGAAIVGNVCLHAILVAESVEAGVLSLAGLGK